jgi:hypothetical protein
MDCATLLFILAIAGVNFGWQTSPDGTTGYEYIVQVEPELVDAMQRGDSIPIESNVPAGVAPIRKVRVVVGRGELPRKPLRHTANFAGQPGWTSDRYPAASAASASAERYPSQPPSLLKRTGIALSETGTAITDGVQAGMRSAEEQLSRTGSHLVSDSQRAAQQVGQKLQSAGNSLRSATEQTLDATGNQVRQVGNSLGLAGSSPPPPTAASGVSAPPWPQTTSTTQANTRQALPNSSTLSRSGATDTTSAPGMAVTRTATGWTSIGTNVAAPPLLNPPLTAASTSSPGLRVAQNTTVGPNLGPPASSPSSEPLRSVLVDPSRSPTTNSAANERNHSWPTGTAGASATIGRAGESTHGSDTTNSSGLVAVPPRYPSQQNTQSAADRWGDPWAESDPWKQKSQQPPSALPDPPGSSNNAGALATNDGWPTNASNSTNAPNPPLTGTIPSEGQPIIGQAPPTSTKVDFGAKPGLGNSARQTPNLAGTNVAGGNVAPPANQTEQPPWMPLLLVSLSLVGSLSANFYLVLSYVGARQRYISLVQKTADTFRRAAGTTAA